MSEEEIEFLEKWVQTNIEHPYGIELSYCQLITKLIDVYKGQKQQITELQAINEEHKKENGELRATIKNYEENQNRLAFKTNQYMNDVLQNKIISKSKIEKEFEKFTSHNNCFNLGDMQMLLDNIIEED